MIVWLLEKRHNDGLPSIKEVDYLVAVSRPSIRQANRPDKQAQQIWFTLYKGSEKGTTL